MPLIIMCGKPSSGKTTIANQLYTLIKNEKKNIEIISEDSLGLQKAEAYKNGYNEKDTRSTLKSTIERNISKDKIIILDSMNYIKGYRYELWCIARAIGTSCCILHVDTSDDICKIRYKNQKSELDIKIFETLLAVFECPDIKNRWDRPLFTLKANANEIECKNILNDVFDEMCGKNKQKSKLKPTDATASIKLSGTDNRNDIDLATQEIIDKIREEQMAKGGQVLTCFKIYEDLPPLKFQRFIGASELRRLKREFMKLATNLLHSNINDGKAARKLFIDYMNDNV